MDIVKLNCVDVNQILSRLANQHSVLGCNYQGNGKFLAKIKANWLGNLIPKELVYYSPVPNSLGACNSRGGLVKFD